MPDLNTDGEYGGGGAAPDDDDDDDDEGKRLFYVHMSMHLFSNCTNNICIYICI
jgi:hypothetical protein